MVFEQKQSVTVTWKLSIVCRILFFGRGEGWGYKPHCCNLEILFPKKKYIATYIWWEKSIFPKKKKKYLMRKIYRSKITLTSIIFFNQLMHIVIKIITLIQMWGVSGLIGTNRIFMLMKVLSLMPIKNCAFIWYRVTICAKNKASYTHIQMSESHFSTMFVKVAT